MQVSLPPTAEILCAAPHQRPPQQLIFLIPRMQTSLRISFFVLLAAGLFLLATLVCATPVQAQDNPDFYLAENGVTVMCPDANVGDSGEVDGVIYTKRTRTQITTPNAASTCTSGIESMQSQFVNSEFFNGDISSWDVSSVTIMSGMFSGASLFNQNIGSWDVSNVTNMGDMFREATSFNQNIGGWDVSNVTDMSRMFSGAPFNQDIGSWDVSSAVNMSAMFENAGLFDQDIGGWDVSNVTDMSRMFSQTGFNRDIGAWDVANVTATRLMFAVATSFDQNISGWDVSSVTDMGAMFFEARSFDQNLGGWDVSSVETFERVFSSGRAMGFLENASLSFPNYNAMLVGWSTQDLVPGLNFNAGGSQYTDTAADSRQSIIANLGWSISDGGLTDGPDPDAFVTTWQTGSPEESIFIPTAPDTEYDFTIDWGDGTVDNISGTDPNPEHTYTEPGTYYVAITGTFPHFYMNALLTQGLNSQATEASAYDTQRRVEENLNRENLIDEPHLEVYLPEEHWAAGDWKKARRLTAGAVTQDTRRWSG